MEGEKEYADTLERCYRNTPRGFTDVVGEALETIVRSLRVTRGNPRCHSCHWAALFFIFTGGATTHRKRYNNDIP